MGLAVVLLWLLGCASPGAPQPPSLRLPRPVEDLDATRKGDHVLLSWTPPTKTTDGENIKRAGPTLVCRSVASPSECTHPVATLKDVQVEHWTKGTMVTRYDYTDTLPKELELQDPTGFATYTLEDQNPQGRSAGLSNEVKVSLAPTLPAPLNVRSKVTPDGVELTWTGVPGVPTKNPALTYFYGVFRQIEGEKAAEMIAGEVPVGTTEFLDRNIEWQKTYVYRIAGITKVQAASGETVEVEGDDSASLTVFANDIFPPAVPTGLQAVYSGVGQKPFIDLTWAPNMEADLAGYNVYRREAGSAWVKINQQLVKSPSFRDSSVEPGHEYFYAVSAVDLRGNESGRSEEASENVPMP